MTAPVFGFLDDAKDSITEFVNNCLLVAGGFLVGYILGGMIGWALGKWAFRQKSPDTLKQLGRPVGGVILAIIVALIVFTGKGKPRGEGGDGKGSPDPSANKAPSNSDQTPKVDPKLPPVKPIDPKGTETRIEVTIRGGTADDRFYQLENDDSRKTIDELVTAIKSRKVEGKIVLVIRSPTKDYLDPEHRGVKQLRERARTEGFGVFDP
jgi:hypothetical protein